MPINKNELTMERVRKALSGFSVGGGDLQGDRSPGAEPCAVASGTVRREGR